MEASILEAKVDNKDALLYEDTFMYQNSAID